MLAEHNVLPLRQSGSAFRFSNPLIERLSSFVTLDSEECDVVASMTATRRIVCGTDLLVREGTTPSRVYLIVKGIGYRYRYLPNGRRQILGFLLPGDLCDTQFLVLNRTDHNVGVMCDTEVAVISPPVLMSAMVQNPRIERALLMMAIAEAAIMREWLLNLGQRDASQKLAHFFCEIKYRVNQCADQCFNLPLTQSDLADTMGLTAVHVNRVLQQFRRQGLINWSRGHFDILDRSRLEQIAGFDPAYLQIGKASAELNLSASG